jgi:hypothetical protein
MKTVRIPKAGERIRIKLRKGNWIWSEVKRFLPVDGEMFECLGGWILHIDDYGETWRYGEDDPVVCAERPAIEDEGDE